MLHEIFFALLGSPVNLLKILDGEKLINGNSRRHPCEGVFIDKIMLISTQYQKLRTFVSLYEYSKEERVVITSSQTSMNKSAEQRSCGVVSEESVELDDFEKHNDAQHPGIYLQALCGALNNELRRYISDIVALEKKALQNPLICPYACIVAEAGCYSELFQVLNSIILEIETQNIRGCAIVHCLQKRLVSGSSEVLTVLTSLLRQCQAVMMNQISKWLLGYLVDFHNEFFIVDSESDRSSSFMDATTNTFNSSRTRMNRSINPTTHNVSINYEMLPSCVKPSIAEKILYVGKMITLFQDDPRNVTKLGIQVQTTKQSVWGDKEDEYFQIMNSMCRTEILDELVFARVIDEIKAMVAERTWQYFVVETDLFQEINLMKDFFLLGRGELFLEFLYKTDGVRNRHWYRHEMDKNCREAFIMAAHQVMFTDESALKKFSVHFPLGDYKETDFDLFQEKDGWWHILNLKYTPKWPMHLIFTPVIIENYNKLFNFLMRVKKAQRDLHEIWLDHMQERTKLFSSSVSTKVWQLRNNLMFVINNLQYYLQVDVLESQFTVLQEKMHKSRDFEEIIRIHSLFQASIMSQSFLATHMEASFEESSQENSLSKIECKTVVHDILLAILALADKFCKTVSSSMSSVQEMTIDKVFSDFEFNVSFLLRYMEQLLKKTSGVNVSQLYIRLNFNDWFSKTLQMDGKSADKDISHI